jgi:hypothetical protein
LVTVNTFLVVAYDMIKTLRFGISISSIQDLVIVAKLFSEFTKIFFEDLYVLKLFILHYFYSK